MPCIMTSRKAGYVTIDDKGLYQVVVIGLQWLLLLSLIPDAQCNTNNVAVGEQCRLNTTCVPLQYTTCLGATLPYTHTSTILANDSNTQTQIQEKLQLWKGLKNAPRCWEVVQQFLCAVYMPKCDPATGQVDLPSKEICELTRQPCRIVESTRGWPEFLQCNEEHFRSNCKNLVPDLKFNTSGKCEAPLVATDNKASWYEGVEGCGVQCENPLFTKEEHDQVHILIGVVGTVCLLCTLFTILTFIIDWKNASKFPALILFFINSCFFVGSIGWLAQFIPGAREDIVCRSDGTLRISEPQIGSGESASCAVIFVMVYYSMMAGVMWFAILAYAWHLSFKALGTPRNAIEGKKGTFHIIAWCTPLVLTIICLALTQIDGDTVSGICFIGAHNNQYRTAFVLGSLTVSVSHAYRGSLVLLPIAAVIIAGLVFLFRGLVTLIKLRLDSPSTISDKATAKIMETILRIGLFALFALLSVIVTFIVHVYIFTNEPTWIKSFKDFVICEANVTVAKQLGNQTTSCKIESRPNLVAMEIHIFAFFGAGILMSSWVWNRSTADTWKRFLRKVFRLPNNEPIKLKKHKMIAQAFNKRREINNGRMSFSFHSTHDDPLGMKFELNSVSSYDMSSNWAAVIPRMVTRRGGMVVPTAGTMRRYSDSDVGSVVSTIHHSRRLSAESYMSQKEAELHYKRKKKRKKRMRNRIGSFGTPSAFVNSGSLSRRGSTSSKPHVEDFRRGSGTSVDTNASANIVQLSVYKQDSSDANSLDLKFTRTNVPANKHAAADGSPITQPVAPPHFAAVNHMTQYSLFTASSFLPPPGTVQMSDLADAQGHIGKDKCNAGSSKPSDLGIQGRSHMTRRGSIFNPGARRGSVMHDISIIDMDYDNPAYETSSSIERD